MTKLSVFWWMKWATFNTSTGKYERYADQTPPAERQFAQVFENDHGESVQL